MSAEELSSNDNLTKHATKEVEFDCLGDWEDDELNGVSFVEISKTLAARGSFIFRTELFERLTLFMQQLTHMRSAHGTEKNLAEWDEI